MGVMNTPSRSDYRFTSVLLVILAAWLAISVYVPYATFNSYSHYDKNGMVAAGIPRDANPPHVYAIPSGDDFAVFTEEQWMARTMAISFGVIFGSGLVAALLAFVAWSFIRPRSV
jgi:hypothetical protein